MESKCLQQDIPETSAETQSTGSHSSLVETSVYPGNDDISKLLAEPIDIERNFENATDENIDMYGRFFLTNLSSNLLNTVSST